MSQNGKGSKRRPSSVPEEEVAKNWEKIFRKSNKIKLCKKQKQPN